MRRCRSPSQTRGMSLSAATVRNNSCRIAAPWCVTHLAVSSNSILDYQSAPKQQHTGIALFRCTRSNGMAGLWTLNCYEVRTDHACCQSAMQNRTAARAWCSAGTRCGCCTSSAATARRGCASTRMACPPASTRRWTVPGWAPTATRCARDYWPHSGLSAELPLHRSSSDSARAAAWPPCLDL